MKIGNAESRVENSKVDKKIGVIMLPNNVEHIFFFDQTKFNHQKYKK